MLLYPFSCIVLGQISMEQFKQKNLISRGFSNIDGINVAAQLRLPAPLTVPAQFCLPQRVFPDCCSPGRATVLLEQE